MSIRHDRTKTQVNNQPILDWTIRKSTSEDADSVAQIYNHYVKVGGSTFDNSPWSRAEAAAHIESELPDGWFVATTLAQTLAQTLGWASVRRYSARNGYRLTCETAIYLSPTALGSGVADALQQRIDQHCQQHGMHHAVAKIIADNQRSLSFHRRHGYELVGIQKEIGRIEDRWVDVAILQKIYC